jgi:tetratricopeptide (TPR) repeat protein
LGINGKNIEAWSDLTDCLLKENKYDIAEMAIQQAIKLSSDNIDFHMTYLDIARRTHNSTDYVRILGDEKRKFSKQAGMRLLWARAQEFYMNDAAGAKRSYGKFLQLAPSDHPEIPKIQQLLKTYRKENH